MTVGRVRGTPRSAVARTAGRRLDLLPRAVGLLVAAAVVVAAAGCGGSASGGGAPSSAAAAGAAPTAGSTASGSSASAVPASLIAKAKSEGEIDLTYAGSTAGGSPLAHRIAALVASQYGVKLQVIFTPGPSMPAMTARLNQEYQAHQPASSDIWVGDEGQLSTALKQGEDFLQAEPWSTYSPVLRALSASTRNEMVIKNLAVEIYNQIPAIVYNTNLVAKDRVPHTMADLLAPYWKGKIVSTPYAAGFARLSASNLWGPAKVKSYVQAFLKNVGGLTRCGPADEVASGQFPLMALDCASLYATPRMVKGAPVSYVIPTDAADLSFIYMGVPKNAPHPAAATLFILAMMSPQGQAALWQVQSTDDYELPGSHSAAVIKQAEARGAKFTRIDYAFVQQHKEPDILRPQLVKLFEASKAS